MKPVIRLRRRTGEIKSDVGGISSRARPDPIPNSEVKTAWANDSHTHVCAKVGGCPLYQLLRLNRRSFCYSTMKIYRLALRSLGEAGAAHYILGLSLTEGSFILSKFKN